MELGNKTVLERVIEQVKKSKLVRKIILATPDEELIGIADGTGIGWSLYKGKRDVLNEYYLAAKRFGAEIIVRITADCPLIEPRIIDEVISEYLNSDCDICFNTCPNDMEADGSDVEIFDIWSLKRAWLQASGGDREHVTGWIRKNMKAKHIPTPDFKGLSLDTKEDYEKICKIWGIKNGNSRCRFRHKLG